MFRRKDRSVDPEEDLALEVESFLRGGYVDYMKSRALKVPSWASLNAVAHASPTQLLVYAILGPAAIRGDDDWEAVGALLAREIFANARGRVEVMRAMQLLLVGLELKLLDEPMDDLGARRLLALSMELLGRRDSRLPPSRGEP